MSRPIGTCKTLLRRADGAVHDLTNLPASGAIVRAERAVTVAGNYVMIVGCLNITVERVRPRHIKEVWAADSVYRPLLGQHHYLAQLRPLDVCVWAERAVCVAGDDAPVIGRFD